MAYNILIVDDSSPMRAIIKKIVKSSGFDVGEYYEAANGKEAMAILDGEWLDVVLTDYNMPDMDGLQLLEEMKKDEIKKAIPVVVITTEGSQARVAEFLEKGAVGYIKKPFTPEQIRKQLAQILGETSHEDGHGSVDDGGEALDF